MYHEVMPVDPKDLRLAMRRWITGVTVVSAAAREVRHGMTVSSFTSVSLDPPLVLVSLDRESSTHRLVEQVGRFGVSILSQDQREISDRFAGCIYMDTDRFTGLDTYTLVTGAPLLAHSLAAFDCQVVYSYEAGMQTLFIGEVLALKTGADGFPLIYFNQDYRSLME
jgi:flavin reductase (DIM6/NTAB) family NADH-FMN oxidoreductase RutF